MDRIIYSKLQNRSAIACLVFQLLIVSACTRRAQDQPEVSADILAEVNSIRAIDNHAHPVRFVAAGEPDREFDALPVDNMEPQSLPLQLRPDDPGVLLAWRELWSYPYADMTQPHLKEWKEHKQRTAQQKADQYPGWVLDSMGVDIMLANRVHMGTSIQPPRFRWVPYVDALLFPLDNSQLAAKNSDRKAFFALEEAGRRQYLKEAGLDALPKTLDEYLRLVVTATLERQKQGGAVAEKFEVAYLRPFGFDKADRVQADTIRS